MSEKQPSENYEDRLLRVRSSNGSHDVFAHHVTVFAYSGTNSMFDNMYIKHPDAENSMYYWRYRTETGEEVEGYEALKWRAIQLGSRALLNLGDDAECLAADRDTYVKHSITDLDEEHKFDVED